jgi:putative transcriptional regulator
MGKAKGNVFPKILRSKGELTKFQILAEVLRSQPHVKQKDIGDALGITVQAVSKYFSRLEKEGFLEAGVRRANYKLTQKAHKKLEEYLADLESYVRTLRQELKIERIWPAIASHRIRAGETVNLEMREGVLYAVPFKNTSIASGKAISDAEPGEDVGLIDLRGQIRLEPGKVLIVELPSINEGGSRAVDIDKVRRLYNEFRPHKIGVMGTVGRAVLNKLGVKAGIEFGISNASALAALRGLRVFVLAVGRMVSRIIDEIELTNVRYNANITYEVRDCQKETEN